MGDYVLFAAAFFAAAVTPGTDTILILSRAITNKSAAIITASGITLAKVLMVTIAYFGLSALISSFPWALTIMKILGASYLIWRAVILWNTDQIREAPARKSSEFASAFAIGFTNPQPFAFYLSIVPLVVGTTSLPILLVIVVLGFAIVTGIYVSLAALIAKALESKANVVFASRILSAIFLLLAIVLVTR